MTEAAKPVKSVKAAPAKTETVVAKDFTPPVLTGVRTDIAIPAHVSHRGGKSPYNFSALTEVGMSFGIKNKTLKQVKPAVSRQNKNGRHEITDAVTGVKSTAGPLYAAFEVGADDPDGASVRVFRIL